MKPEEHKEVVEMLCSYGIISLDAESIAECLADEGYEKVKKP